MKHLILILIFLLFSSTNLLAKNKDEKSGLLEVNIQTDILFRQDSLNWNIAGNINGGSPNILSELTWETIQSSQLRTEGNVIIKNKFIIYGMAAYGYIFSGKNQDSDYLGDNRTFEFSRSNNNAGNGKMQDYSGAFGYRIRLLGNYKYLNSDSIWVTTFGGYSHHRQNLAMKDGVQTLSTLFSPDLGPINGLESKYDSRWKGPWFGMNLVSMDGNPESFFQSSVLGFEYHFADYHGIADWNLRQEFKHPVSFEHFAKGNGVIFQIGVNFLLTGNTNISFNTNLQSWKTGNGIDRIHEVNGGILETRLNNVNWQSYSFMLGVNFNLF